jgi:TfoX/Sxy family transcriptional regulator of competence genes
LEEQGMTYDENLAQRLRERLLGSPNLTEMKMFGGIAFLINGNMAFGVIQNDLIVRVGPQESDQALAASHTKPFAMTGRAPMSGWVQVEPPGFATKAALQGWIDQGLHYAQSLPPKSK